IHRFAADGDLAFRFEHLFCLRRRNVRRQQITIAAGVSASASTVLTSELCSIGSLYARGVKCAARGAWRKTRQPDALALSAVLLCPRRARPVVSRTNPRPNSAAVAASLLRKPLLRLRLFRRAHLALTPPSAASSQ